MALVAQFDVAELYAAIKEQLQKTTLVILGLLSLGLWLIHKPQMPLVKNLDAARAQVEKELARCIAAIQGGLDAFYIFDAMCDENMKSSIILNVSSSTNVVVS